MALVGLDVELHDRSSGPRRGRMVDRCHGLRDDPRRPPHRRRAMSTRLGDRVMSRLARLLVRVFFRRIDVEGAERMPTDGALVLVAVLPRYPRFLGKATLYRILPLAPFLHLAGVVPVHRAKDAEGASGRA